MAVRSFRQHLEISLREAANDNLDVDATADTIITDLRVAGFAIKRACDPVDYALPIMVIHSPDKGTAGSFDALPHVKAASVDDLLGHAGWLVVWTEHGRARSAWFDHEGASRKLPDYRVVNPKTPCAGSAYVPLPNGKFVEVA
ncbi:hypothetical protein [Thalassospira lohafexi]|uniref:Uncharacterized protein n=1 Tax=Thalassospira lohafexi TaxID=744227 RepID=A0A2N3L3U6_9PROT|nr:hypothetical protein [Thalassospira lohafexi]PKR57481.1 hypothetical protein COO92_16195 [Thalassospira lohafexi]